jgi:hypothetical protein
MELAHSPGRARRQEEVGTYGQASVVETTNK